jgi:hypothetical protein
VTIEVSYHETVSKLQEFAQFARGPFDRPEWYALLEQGGFHPVIVVGRSSHRIAALPLMAAGHGLTSLAYWFSFTWRPLGRDDELVDEILTAMAKDLRSHASAITLAPLPDEDGSASRLEQAFRKAGWAVFREQPDENHVLHVDGRSFAEYWASRPGPMRTTLKRKAKKVDVEILTHFDERAWAEYRIVYRNSWKPAEERADILEAFARMEGGAGRIRLGIARAEGVPVAAQFWTVENGTAFIHKLAYLESHKHLSAGTTLTAELFRHVIDIDRVALVDFGTGDQSYKADWMEEVRPRYRIDCLDPARPRAWPALAKRLLRGSAKLAPSPAHG